MPGNREIILHPDAYCTEHRVTFGECGPAHTVPGMVYRLGRNPDDVEALNEEILKLKQEVGMWRSKYEHLDQIYNKLADQWNVFQATNKPDNRNIQRAEGAGEMARKLAEVLLCLAYDHDARDLIQEFLGALHDAQDPASGQEVTTVSGKMEIEVYGKDR